jgi:hypothetical protein
MPSLYRLGRLSSSQLQVTDQQEYPNMFLIRHESTAVGGIVVAILRVGKNWMHSLAGY